MRMEMMVGRMKFGGAARWGSAEAASASIDQLIGSVSVCWCLKMRIGEIRMKMIDCAVPFETLDLERRTDENPHSSFSTDRKTVCCARGYRNARLSAARGLRRCGIITHRFVC